MLSPEREAEIRKIWEGHITGDISRSFQDLLAALGAERERVEAVVMDYANMKRERDEALALLRKVEHKACLCPSNEEQGCYFCEQHEHEPHAPDCRLDALLSPAAPPEPRPRP